MTVLGEVIVDLTRAVWGLFLTYLEFGLSRRSLWTTALVLTGPIVVVVVVILLVTR